MDIFVICVTIVVAASAVWTVARRGEDDPNWELRWRVLDLDHRNWLAAMTTDPSWMKTLSDPEEVLLAQGFERRERRRLAPYDAATGAVAVLLVAVSLAGLAPLSTAGIAIGLGAGVRWVVESQRHRQIKRKVKLGFEPGELPTPLTQPRP